MSCAILESWVLEIQFDGVNWSDVTDDVVISDLVRGEYGIMDNGPLDRVARTGRLQFSLDNSTNNSAGLAGYYSPGHANCRSGFTTGIPVRVRFTYDSMTRTKFYGRIAKDGIQPTTGIYGQRRTKITVLDWMNQASTHDMILPAYTTNKRIDEIAPLIVGNMPLAPIATNYQTGADTFTSVFDTVGAKTTAMSEFQKLAQSEWSYIYVDHNIDYDEVLTVEGRNTRSSAGTAYTVIPVGADVAGYLLLEDGGYLLQEDGSKLILNDSEPADFFEDTAAQMEVSYGKHLSNYITVTSYPRAYSPAATILYEVQNGISLAAGETRDIVANFRDPENKAVRVAAVGVVAPVGTTDYKLGTSTAGTDNALATALTLGSFSYGANAGSYSFTNNGVTNGYLWFQTRGTAVYLYDGVEYIAQGTASQAAHGLQSINVNMPYQASPDTAEQIGAFLRYDLENPRYEVDKYSFWANRDSKHLFAFISLEIGERIRISETQSGFSRDRHIDGIQFEIHPNKQVKCTWLTRFISSVWGWTLGIDEQTELGETTILG